MRSVNILLVEDDPFVSDVICWFLGSRVGSIEVVPGIHNMLERCVSGKPEVDLLLIDLGKETNSSIEEIKSLRSIIPEFPIVAISTRTGEWPQNFVEHVAKSIGVQEILPEPFGPRELLGAIKETLGDDVVYEEAELDEEVL